MELVGLVLAFPAVFIANVAYVLFVQKVFLRYRALWPWLLWPSRIIVGLLILDVAAVAIVGAVSSRQSLGVLYTVLHVLVVFLGAPALANILLIPGGQGRYRRWYFIAAYCFLVGMFLVFFQAGVGDALYGPDGVGGPYSR